MGPKDYLTLAIGVIALAVSIVSAVIATRRQRTQIRTTIRDQLATIVQELITTLAENRILQSEDLAKRDALFYSKSSSFSLKLSSLARQASALVAEDRDNVFDVEYAVIAQALDVVGDIPTADQYWQWAVASSPSDYYKIVNQRGYADFLFRQGRHQAGRKQYEDAAAVLDSNSDFNKWTNGYTYQMWFISEVWSMPPPHGRAEDCYRDARSLYESISSSITKANCLQSLETARLAIPSAPAPPTPSNITAPRPEPEA